MKTEDDIMVSVVCITYNHEKFIEKCLNSIKNQKINFRIEVLVGEDCSTDRTRNVLEEYRESAPDYFHFYLREKNLGATRNGYELLMRTRGKYVASCEGDDYWCDENKLQKQVDFLETHPEYAGVYTDYHTVDEDGKIIIEHSVDRKFIDKPFFLKDFQKYGHTVQTASQMYRNIWKEKADFTVLYKAHELIGDITIKSFILVNGPVYIMPDVCSCYRRVRSVTRNNACSQQMKNPTESAIKQLRQYDILDEYFKGKVNYDVFRGNIVSSYWASALKKAEGYSFDQYKAIKRKVKLSTRWRAFFRLYLYELKKVVLSVCGSCGGKDR